jgi:hypothetical protein
MGVINAQVFCHSDSEVCRGILLTYGNGSQRVLGECRVGVDRSVICRDPLRICFTKIEYSPPGKRYRLRGTRVEATHAAEHSHELQTELAWECLSMKGALEFWYDFWQSELHHVGGD